MNNISGCWSTGFSAGPSEPPAQRRRSGATRRIRGYQPLNAGCSRPASCSHHRSYGCSRSARPERLPRQLFTTQSSNLEPLISNFQNLPETPIRVEPHASHKKQKIARQSTRDGSRPGFAAGPLIGTAIRLETPVNQRKQRFGCTSNRYTSYRASRKCLRLSSGRILRARDVSPLKGTVPSRFPAGAAVSARAFVPNASPLLPSAGLVSRALSRTRSLEPWQNVFAFSSPHAKMLSRNEANGLRRSLLLSGRPHPPRTRGLNESHRGVRHERRQN